MRQTLMLREELERLFPWLTEEPTEGAKLHKSAWMLRAQLTLSDLAQWHKALKKEEEDAFKAPHNAVLRIRITAGDGAAFVVSTEELWLDYRRLYEPNFTGTWEETNREAERRFEHWSGVLRTSLGQTVSDVHKDAMPPRSSC